jgi:putative transposase
LKHKFRDLVYKFPNTFEKINQIEIGKEYAYVSVSFKEKELKLDLINNVIGIDLNTTRHIVVASNPQTGKVWKFGKAVEHIHKKYKNIRRSLQKLGKYKKVKQIKNRESRIVRNINHKISKEIVKIAQINNCGTIKLEKLQNIRQNKKHPKSFRYCLNSWSFYQLQKFVEYKAKLQGILVFYIDPRYTSKTCSRCGYIGNRNDKRFECLHCRHVDHADVNASFNIGKPVPHCILSFSRKTNIGQFDIDRIDISKGNPDIPKEETQVKMIETLEPHTL